MKKIIASILTFILLFQAVNIAFAVQEKPDNIDEALKLVDYLDIIDLSTATDVEVTRADFAVYVARILHVDEYSTENKTYYYDVPMTHWAAPCINALVSANALTVGDDKMFRPDDKITLDEATKILGTIMGYTTYAEINGGYPNGWRAVATATELYSKVEVGNTVLTRKNAAVLIANALNTEIYEKDYRGSDIYYVKNEDKSLLSIYYNMYTVEGRVTAVNETSLYPGNSADNSITIDDNVYSYYGDNSLIGCEVKAYYTESKSEDATVVLLFDKTASSDVVEIDAKNIVSFTEDYVLKYYKNETASALSSEKIDRGAAFIYNGIAVDTDIIDRMTPSEGTVKLMKSKTASKYDTVIINEYESFVVGYVDSDKSMVYDASNNANSLDLSGDKERVSIFNSNGEATTIASIAKNSVLTVCRHAGEKIVVYVSANEVTGKVTGMDTSHAELKFEVEGKSYFVSKKYADELKSKVVIGSEYTFGLDKFDNIACIKVSAADDEYTYGYYLNHSIARNEGEDKVFVRLYSSDGKLVSYKIADKAKIDGIRCNSTESQNTQLNKSFTGVTALYKEFENRPGNATPRIIRFKSDVDECITAIDTPYRSAAETENTLTLTSADTNVDYIYTGIIGYSTVFDSNTILFKAPADSKLDGATDKSFYAGNMKSTGINCAVMGYKISADSGSCDVIAHITDVTDEVSMNTNFMVSGLESTINDDDEIVEVVTGMRGNTEVSYIVNKDVVNDSGAQIGMEAAGVSEGDILLLSLDSAGNVQQYSIAYDRSADTTHSYVSSGSIFTKDLTYGSDAYSSCYKGYRFTYGFVDSVKDNVISVAYEKGGAVREAYLAKNIAVTVYDSSLPEDKRVHKGTIADIVSYEDAGDECSGIIAYSEYVVWKQYYIYK